MAFVSIRDYGDGRISGSGMRPNKPNMVLREGKSGSCSGRFNRAINFKTGVVDIQIDEELRKVRVGESEHGLKIHQKTQSFSCSKKLVQTIGTDKVFLELNSDGWWYGSY